MLALILTGCASPRGGTVTQVSTFHALSSGDYDGRISCAELLSHGDTGLGTFDRLDGEMIVLSGTVYQARSDGGVRSVRGDVRVPFAEVAHFSPTVSVPVQWGCGYRSLEDQLNTLVPDQDCPCAIRVTGRFSHVRARSVPAQGKPYPPLTVAIKDPPVFDAADIPGTLVGFRAPLYARDMTVPGYHCHFISDNRRYGGHVLDFTLESGKAEVMPCERFLLLLERNSTAK
ncbi:MAG: acetolactate decarboxylase [Candidatus Aureabacteria bacterium]|nr:acetolactate decarboxylase [Candidatus Auribacterota bacterium]